MSVHSSGGLENCFGAENYALYFLDAKSAGRSHRICYGGVAFRTELRHDTQRERGGERGGRGSSH